MEDGGFLEWLSVYQFLEKESAPWSWYDIKNFKDLLYNAKP
jgi:hypothetical protein